MLTLDQLIAEATALPDTDKTILIEKLMESMAEQLDQDLLLEGIQKAQKRLAEIDSGLVQAIPRGIAWTKPPAHRAMKYEALANR